MNLNPDLSRYNDAKQSLLHTFNLLAPNGQAQRGFVNLLHDLEADHTDPKRIILALVNGLHDGFAYGNWPGITPHTISELEKLDTVPDEPKSL